MMAVLSPFIVNGTRVTWLMDTGINFTAISDAEARRLGMEIQTLRRPRA